MKINLMNGAVAEITCEEAHRIAKEIHGKKDWLEKALDDIERCTGERPETEADMWDLMYRELHLGDREETKKAYELIEGIIEMHFAMHNL